LGENRGGKGWDRRGQDWYGRRERKGNEGGCTKRVGTGRSSGEGNYGTMLNILQSEKG